MEPKPRQIKNYSQPDGKPPVDEPSNSLLDFKGKGKIESMEAQPREIKRYIRLNGTVRFFGSGIKASQRSFFTQEASGDRSTFTKKKSVGDSRGYSHRP